ncbi:MULTISPECIES: hypothetical protein [unclassified Meiothermus]|uniref:hypothetical protein n=1 Tax=unclassified Meiothermus TaxID=370471 RepID=UPI00102048E7|nr:MULTISPECIES: hypothetical protein [unclassified Meiothermus]RYM40765.1 hypothetical protein EWH23_01165 [Meiothermus sp. PNK-Is4]
MPHKPTPESELERLTRKVSRVTLAMIEGLEAGFRQAGVKPEDLEALAAQFEQDQQSRRARMEAEHEQRVRSLRERFGRS